MSMKEILQRRNLTPLPMLKRSVSAQVPLNDESLLENIKQLVEQAFVDSVTYYRMEFGIEASYAVAYKKEDKISHCPSYEFFYK